MGNPENITPRGCRVLQLVNTLAVSDGGPARNAAELNRALSRSTRSNLAWVKGDRTSSLVRAHARRPQQNTAWGLLETGGLADAMRAFASADVVVIHGYYLWWAPLAASVGRLCRKRVLLTPHGSLTAYQQDHSKLKKKLFEVTVGWLLRRSVHKFAVGSARERAELLDRFPSLDATVVGVGTTIPPEPLAQGEWSSPLRLLSLSRIAPKKRIDLMIEAVALLKNRGSAVRLSIAGDGDPVLQSALEDKCVGLGVQHDVEFLGLLDETGMRHLITEGDIFLAPSDDENFGIAAAEALAAGLPSVVSKYVDSMHEVEGRFLITLEERTPMAIADAIVRLAARSKTELTQQAHDASRAFAWSDVAERWKALANDR